MSRYSTLYIVKDPNPVPLDQLIQLLRIVSDGDLISKEDRNKLVKMGFATQKEGFNIITGKGILYLVNIGKIQD